MKKIRLFTFFWTYTVLTLTGASVRAQDSPSIAGAPKAQLVTVELGVKLEVLDWGGTGRPVVLLAGLGSTAHGFDTFAPRLTSKYHVYGITRRGFGASDTPPVAGENYSADRLGDDVIAVLDDLKLEHPVLVGHSIAGEELSSIGSRFPKRVAGLVYLDAGYAYALYDASGGDVQAVFQIDTNELLRQLLAINNSISAADRARIMETVLKELPNYGKLLAARQKVLATFPPMTPQRREAAAAQMKTRDAMSSLAVIHGEQRYTDIKCPVLAIFAEPHSVDPSTSPKERAMEEETDVEEVEPQAKAFEALGSNVHVVRIPHADHSVFRSNEAEVLREMNSFIATLQ
jgi:non-heme chloroperoxidase